MEACGISKTSHARLDIYPASRVHKGLLNDRAVGDIFAGIGEDHN